MYLCINVGSLYILVNKKIRKFVNGRVKLYSFYDYNFFQTFSKNIYENNSHSLGKILY